MQKLQDSGVPPNQIIQITGHKTYSQLTNTVLCQNSKWKVFHVFFPRQPKPLPTSHRPKTAQPLAEYRVASTSTTSSTSDVNSFDENRLHTMFHGNYIIKGVFKINLAPAKNEVKSPEVDPRRKKRRLIIESDSSEEFTT